MKRSRQTGWRWYRTAVARHRWALAGAVALGITLPLANLPALWLAHHVFDTAIPQRDVHGLLLAVAAILGIRLLAIIPALLFSRRVARGIRAVGEELRNETMARLHRLEWRDLGKLEASPTQVRLVTDSERIEQMTLTLFQSLIPTAVPTMLIYGAVLFLLSWQLTLVLVVLAPLLRLLGWWSARHLQRWVRTFQQRFEGYHTASHNALLMLRTTRVQTSEDAALAEYRRHTRSLAEAGADMAAASALNVQFNSLGTGLVAVVVLALGGFAVIDGALSIGTFAAFFFAAAQVNTGLSNLIAGLPSMLSGHVAIARFAELQTVGSEEPVGGATPPDFAQPIVFVRASFAYDDRQILDEANFRIEPGRTTALAAPNGIGKSTVLGLAAGLVRPDGGDVRLGNVPLGGIDKRRYREAIGLLPQDPAFLPGSIADNIRFGRPHLDDAALYLAVHRAGLDPVLVNLPLGIATPMGETGQMLSGGERQRVALARALIHEPQLLMLDEPSNHLDDAAVSLLIERLFRAADRPTILMATHDLRLLAVADQVYDLASGGTAARPALRLVKTP